MKKSHIWVLFCVFMTLLMPLGLTSTPFRAILIDIRQSEHTFVRNGRQYSGEVAYRWLRYKTMHRQFNDNPIKTKCDFIKRVATRSNTTGEMYGVLIDGKWHWLGKWLEKKYGLTC